MKKNLHFLPLLALCSAAMLPACSSQSKAEAEGAEIFYADPTIYAEGGKYYLTGTRNANPLGFALLESDDLKSWRPATHPDSLILTPGSQVFGDKGFWAPQLLKNADGSYTIFYTANEQTAVAHAPNLTDAFTQPTVEAIDGSEGNIDPFLFRDDDGKEYLYHVRFNKGNFLWVGEFDSATGKIVDGTLRQCFANTQPWEATPAYDSAPIMEGPTVVKLDNIYYLFYSANHFMSVDYAVGYATATSPLGPWVKNEANPIIHRSIVGENGSGHGDIFKDAEGKLRYVYHVHNSDSVVAPRRTRIVSLNLDATGDSLCPYNVTVDASSIINPLAINN